MPGPVQLNITITQNAAGTITSPTIVVPIPAALQSLDSGGAQGQAAQQTGYSSVDQLVRAIFRAHCFTDGQGNWYSAFLIQKITFT